MPFSGNSQKLQIGNQAFSLNMRLPICNFLKIRFFDHPSPWCSLTAPQLETETRPPPRKIDSVRGFGLG
jgi:hypothetical protein